jgi:hypothetical protein
MTHEEATNPGLDRNQQPVGQAVLLKPDRMLEMCS